MSSAQSMAESGRFAERRPLVLGGVPLLLLSFQTLGIIYSDIGTSPLYVLNGIWPADQPPPSEEDVVGGVSAIIWSLTLVPLLKYVFIGLRFGTEEGEGGTFALFHALFPPPRVDHDDERTLTGEFTPSSGGGVTLKRSATGISQGSRLGMWKWPLLIWALFGTSLTMADGIFTPAVSVTSAVSGLALVQPSLNYSIIPISIAFLVVLFFVQRFGTAKLAFTFAPVTCVWLLLLGVTGIYNIVSFPGIFRAFDPSRAVMLFVRTGKYDILSGVLLAVTGCEALFANLGQFNMLSIQLSFATFTYPALVLAYLGQGARLVRDGEAVIANIFYATIPGPTGGPLYWIMYAFAILATLVASQTMITAVFSLIQQIINLKSLPPLQMCYTSETVQGQIYVPAVNWILFIATIAVVAGFQSPVALTNAYGFSVATVMIVTSTLIAISIPLVKGQHWIFGLAFFIFFGFIDGLFWGASLTKVPQGAWVPLMLGAVLMILMTFWTWAKGLEDAFDGANRRNLRQIIVSGNEQTQPLLDPSPMAEKAEDESEKVEAGETSGPYPSRAIPAASTEDEATALYLVSDIDDSKTKLARLPTCAVFHKFAAGKGVPHSFFGFLRQWPALPRVIIFLSVRIVPMAHVEKSDRYFVTKVRSVPGFYGVTYCLGFRDDFKVDVNDVIERIVSLEIRADPRESRATVNEIRNAGLRSTHIIPHYHVVSDVHKSAFGFLTPAVRWTRGFLIEGIYRRLVTMFPETANWLESADEIIRVGVTAQI